MERRILLTFGFPNPHSPRYRNLVQTYQKEGWDIRECLTSVRGFFAKHRELRTLFRENRDACDAVLVNFPGYYLMPLAWWLTRMPRKKLIFDAFISISDTVVSDRGLISWWNPIAWFLYAADIVSCHLADEVLIDTEAHKRFFARRFFLNPARIRVMYVGTREDLFRPGPKGHMLPEGKFNVLFIGTYIPLQGIDVILRAAKILERNADMHFTLIGKGQTYGAMRDLAKELSLTNVTFLDFQPIDTLPSYLRSCDVALGIFGTSDKANRVIAHKVYDAVGCGVPIITARNDAIGEKFTDGKEVFLCEPGDPDALAAAILGIKTQK